MNIVATIEARMTSSRLPGKMMLALGDKPVLAVLIDRLKLIPELNHIVLATTTNAADDVLVAVACERGIDVFRGSEEDVLSRVRGALDMIEAETCVKITGDCPLTDPAMISMLISEFKETRGENAYVANVSGSKIGAPPGLDAEVFEAAALRVIETEFHDIEAREHVSPPFYRPDSAPRWNPRFVEFFPEPICRSVWLSLDYREDYDLIRSVYEELYPRDPAFSAQSMIESCRKHPAATRACLALRGL